MLCAVNTAQKSELILITIDSGTTSLRYALRLKGVVMEDKCDKVPGNQIWPPNVSILNVIFHQGDTKCSTTQKTTDLYKHVGMEIHKR